MHLKSLRIVTTAVALAFPYSAFALSGSAQNPQSSAGVNTPLRGQREAMKMVPAQAALLGTLDAKKMQPGYRFRARLADTVHLDNGTELPSGTVLAGKVVADDMNVNGRSKLAICFTDADLKNGKVIPIKATIVGVFKPESGVGYSGYDVAPGNQEPNSWSQGTLQIDQINVTSGVDLHSKIASNDSGVFVSTKKDDVKLGRGTEVALAIAPARLS